MATDVLFSKHIGLMIHLLCASTSTQLETFHCLLDSLKRLMQSYFFKNLLKPGFFVLSISTRLQKLVITENHEVLVSLLKVQRNENKNSRARGISVSKIFVIAPTIATKPPRTGLETVYQCRKSLIPDDTEGTAVFFVDCFFQKRQRSLASCARGPFIEQE